MPAKKTTTKKTATKKTTTKKAVTKKTAAKKTTRKKTATKTPARKKTVAAKKDLSPREEYKMVEKAAYFLAEKDGFRRDPMLYWLTAEQQILKRSR